MNRATRRALRRADRNKGRGWTRPAGKRRSMEQIRLVGIGERRMAHLAANLERLPLRLERGDLERKAA